MQRCYGLFEHAPNAGVVDGFPVWVVLNGEPAGLYTWNIPKDEWMHYCFMCVSYAPDNRGKNILLVTRDGQRWAPTLYDLDSLWGIDWKGTGLWDAYGEINLDTVIQCRGLFGRIRDCFPEEVRARYAELRQYPLSRANIRAEFERFRAEIPEEYYEMDKALWYPNDDYIRSYERMYSLLDEYLPRVDAAFGFVEAPETNGDDLPQ